MNYEKELNNLKDGLEKAKDLRYRAEARLEQLNKQEEEIIIELKELGIEPKDLESEINTLNLDIQNLFKEANSLLPKDLIGNK